MKIPFSKPCFTGTEEKNIASLLQSGATLAGGGSFNKSCESLLKEIYKKPVLITTSATHALELSALLLQIKPGDEVILPSFTFVSSANPFLLRGAIPRFVDNDAFGNIDLDCVEKAVSAKTKAIVVVHYAGNSCDMDKLVSFCKTKSIALIEDAAQCIDSAYKNKPLGTFGITGCLSFHDTKNITSGEGGALIVNDALHSRAEILREKGTNRSQFLQGLVDKYTWVDVGSSYILSELNAAYLHAGLSHLKSITAKRASAWNRYHDELKNVIPSLGARLLEHPEHNQPNYHIFGFIFSSKEIRPKFIQHMRENGITTPFHYVALHTSPVGKEFIRSGDRFDRCMEFSDGLVRLPLYHQITDEEISYVIEKVKAFRP